MKTLVITGASAGIGLETAKLFLQDDYALVTLSRRNCPLAEARHIACDLANSEARSAAADSVASQLPDESEICLVHNAGTLASGSLMDATEERFKRAIEINMLAPQALNLALVPKMAPGSSIVYLGSTLSEIAVPGSFAYVATRHATLGMMRATCQDLVDTGIHTAAVCPGFTDTEMLRDHLPAEALQSVAQANAFGRLVEPQEIAECIRFVAAQPALNGAVLHANLGQIQR
ncbi:MAG: SDR family NAD(P)-dependent oxidoreductase [Gammaproteobacteria bacterium]|nr:SDR family NAD(P)-dependent oxidoreductase [Gammaproteobacteria bacterium]MCY4324173.1 SDR family NAD(P)-dependent oxidoreductase [Gammaproteobacteria bacterium]